MSKDDFNFQRDLKKAIFEADPDKMDRKKLLISTFKYWVSKLFEYIQTKTGADRLEADYVVQVKQKIINEFIRTDLAEYQLTEEEYDNLFETTVKEILEFAATRHQGVDVATVEQTLSIDPEQYIQEGGLFVPKHLKN
jgi:hypothetical protein